MNDGKMEYTKFGKVSLNNCVSLSHNNILQKDSSMGMISHENTWVLCLPALCFVCAKVVNSTRIQRGSFH